MAQNGASVLSSVKYRYLESGVGGANRLKNKGSGPLLGTPAGAWERQKRWRFARAWAQLWLPWTGSGAVRRRTAGVLPSRPGYHAKSEPLTV